MLNVFQTPSILETIPRIHNNKTRNLIRIKYLKKTIRNHSKHLLSHDLQYDHRSGNVCSLDVHIDYITRSSLINVFTQQSVFMPNDKHVPFYLHKSKYRKQSTSAPPLFCLEHPFSPAVRSHANEFYLFIIMEAHQADHIKKNLAKLVELTTCNPTCIAVLLSSEVFSDDDKAYLDSLPNENLKTLEFYQLLKTRKGAFKHLVSALEKTNQSGALDILTKLAKGKTRSMRNKFFKKDVQNVATNCGNDNSSQVHTQQDFVHNPTSQLCPKTFAPTTEEFLGQTLYHYDNNLAVNNVKFAASAYKYSSEHKSLILSFKGTTWKIVCILYSHRKFNRAQKLGRKLLAILQMHASPEDVAIIKLHYKLALVDFCKGKLEECCHTLYTLLELYYRNDKQEFTEPEILSVEQRLALTLQKLGRRSEQLEVLRQSFQRLNERFGPDHWRTIEAHAAITNCLHRTWKSCQNSPENEFQFLCTPSEIEFENMVTFLKNEYEINRDKVRTNIAWARALFTVAACLNSVGERETAANIAHDVYDKIIHSGEPYQEVIQIMEEISTTLYRMGMYDECLGVCDELIRKKDEDKFGNQQDLDETYKLIAIVNTKLLANVNN